MAIEQVVSVISITNLGISYLTISANSVGATGAGVSFAKTVATGLDLGSFTFEYAFTTSAREQVNALPHEMVLALTPELDNLWRLVRAVESTARGQPEAAPAPTTAAVDATDAPSGDQVEITMGDGSVLKGRLAPAKVPFVSGYGTIEVDTSAITSFADGRLALEDGSALKGAFGDGELALTTSHGALRLTSPRDRGDDSQRYVRDGGRGSAHHDTGLSSRTGPGSPRGSRAGPFQAARKWCDGARRRLEPAHHY